MSTKMAIFFVIIPLWVYSYQWPMFDQYGQPDNKKVSSGYCSFRPAYNSVQPHFHGGIDIPEQENAQQYNLYIWPIDYGVVTNIGGTHPFEWIKIRHYNYTNNQFKDAKCEGSVYRHANPCCAEGDSLTLDDPVAEGWNMYKPGEEHLHLEYRIIGSGSEDYNNPFTITELQIEDNNAPRLFYLYVDYSRQGSADVACWEYLGSDFGQYYGSITGGGYTFLKLTLPEETPWNDWDDPHFIIAGTRKVRFVIQIWDTSNVAPYHYYLSLDTSIVDLAGSRYESSAHYEVKFDILKVSEYLQEEVIYHEGEPIISGLGKLGYYRLYPYGTALNCVLSENKVLETENLEQGQHRIRISAKDYTGNTKTADVHFYIKNSDWVDYCRAFIE